jgi:hypothetical protein
MDGYRLMMMLSVPPWKDMLPLTKTCRIYYSARKSWRINWLILKRVSPRQSRIYIKTSSPLRYS